MDATRATGKSEDQAINKDICNKLRGKIQAMKSETDRAKLDKNKFQDKCRHLMKELEDLKM